MNFWNKFSLYQTSNQAVFARIEDTAYSSPVAESLNEKVEFPFQPVPAGVFRRAQMTARSVGHLW